MLTAAEALDRLRGITFKLRIEKNRHGAWEWGSAFFISSDGYALTAFHNLPAQAVQTGRGQISGYHKEQWITLECLVSNSLPEHEGDIAVLKWIEPPANGVEHIPVACLDPASSTQQRNRLWAGQGLFVPPIRRAHFLQHAFLSASRP